MTQYYSIKGYNNYSYLTNIFGKCLVFLEGSNMLDRIIALQPKENYQIYIIDSDNNITNYKYSIKDGRAYLVSKIFLPASYCMNRITDFFGIKGQYSIFRGTCNKYKINTWLYA